MDKYYFNILFLATRENKKLSQRRFAEKLNIKPTTVSAIENKRITPSVDLIVKFCDVFSFEVNATSK